MRVRNATERNSTDGTPSSLALAVEVSTIAAPPSLGLQNMYFVSGSLTIVPAAISSTESGLRRHACGVIEPLRRLFAISSDNRRGSSECSCR